MDNNVYKEIYILNKTIEKHVEENTKLERDNEARQRLIDKQNIKIDELENEIKDWVSGRRRPTSGLGADL